MSRQRKRFDLSFTAAPNVPIDLDEVTYLKLYQKPVESTSTTSKATPRPLIDVVTPQPKAFYAYLRMPKEETPSKKPTRRIRRHKKIQ